MLKNRLRLKILLLDLLTFPLNVILFPLYRYGLPRLLEFYLSQKANSNIRVFIRQGVKSSFKKFNFLFSDIDIGLVIEDHCDENSLKKNYYHLKKYIKSLGEVEIYTSAEFDLYNKKPEVFLNLYYKIRKIRQLNWLRGRVQEQAWRGSYHRLKDHRKIFILISELKLKSSFNAVDAILEDLKNYTENEFEFNNGDLSFEIPHIYCDYLSQSISLKNQINNKIFLLAATPTANKGHDKLDDLIKTVRLKNPQVEKVFLQLNEHELLIARAFIRGAPQPEAWHKRWVSQLEAGIKKKPDPPNSAELY